MGAPRLFARRSFTAHTRGGGRGQHPVFGSNPALPLAAKEGRDIFVDGSGADNFGVAAFDQARAVGVRQEVWGDFDVAQAVGSARGAGVIAHDLSFGEAVKICGRYYRAEAK